MVYRHAVHTGACRLCRHRLEGQQAGHAVSSGFIHGCHAIILQVGVCRHSATHVHRPSAIILSRTRRLRLKAWGLSAVLPRCCASRRAPYGMHGCSSTVAAPKGCSVQCRRSAAGHGVLRSGGLKCMVAGACGVRALHATTRGEDIC